MPERLLSLSDVRSMNSPQKISQVFDKLGYKVFPSLQPLPIQDLELTDSSSEAVWDAHLIADQRKGTDLLQVLLFRLKEKEWTSPSAASQRMRSIANSLCKRPSNFLLLGTKNYDQLMLVNPRKSFDAQMTLKTSIRKLLIDRTNPTAYDHDRLEAIAAHNLDPKALYQVQSEAFDVEKLTKDFYRGYKEIFEQVRQVIHDSNPHPYFEDSSRLHQFSQRILGRVMFLYFLQKKGFLDGDRKFLGNRYKQLRPEPEDTDFYAQVLEPLFFDILNRPRPDHDSVLGKIPYLNGGLFDRDYGEGVSDFGNWATPTEIQLPNSLFDPSGEKSILHFFNRYNFTISENIQGDEDVAVDPEMLGKVFENMLEADERGKSGTFYTPRGIVQFMCAESLSRYLADETGMELEAVRQLTEFDANAVDVNINQLLTQAQAKKLKKAIASVKVCDPAVGSGAFPMGMMQVILAVRQAIARREGMTIERGSLTMSEWKREIIANNLYGVDIKPEAVEIAKLRMWLSLVVDIPTLDNVEPLPNLDYKLMCGNSLISTIHGEQMIPDPTKDYQGVLPVTAVQQAIDHLISLQQQYFEAQTDERKQLKAQIAEAEANVFKVAIAERRELHRNERSKITRAANQIGSEYYTSAQQRQLEAIQEKLRELDRIEADVERGVRAIDFFQWHLHFNEVFAGKGGFDIVVGNPPYVRQEQIKAIKPSLKVEYDCYVGTADLFVYFYERGFQLLRPGGSLTYISSNKYMRSGYGEKLRKFLGSKGTIQHLIDFGDAPVFEAIAYPSIMLVNKQQPADHQVRTLTWEPDKSADEFVPVFRSNSFLIAQRELTADGWRLESPATLRLLEKLRQAGQPLGEYVNGRFYYGIKTGLNEAFVVNRATRDRLIAEHPSSADVLKPFLRGRDVKRWRTEPQDLWLIFTRRGIDITRHPAIRKYLNQFRDQLTPGIIGGRKLGSYKWYEIQDNIAYWQEFEQPKIIIPAIAQSVEYALDSTGYFSNDKTSICVTSEPNYLLGVLNSNILWWFIQKTAASKQGGFYEFKPMYVSKLPIPKASRTDCQAITKLVQKCLNAKGQSVETWEAEINDRVARLYGLTADEIKLTEGDK